MSPGRRGGKADDGGEAGAVVDLSLGSVRLELTVWEQQL
jgi:hypothetical protein